MGLLTCRPPAPFSATQHPWQEDAGSPPSPATWRGCCPLPEGQVSPPGGAEAHAGVLQEQPSESAPKPLGKLSILRPFFGDEEELQHRRQVRACRETGWGGGAGRGLTPGHICRAAGRGPGHGVPPVALTCWPFPSRRPSDTPGGNRCRVAGLQPPCPGGCQGLRVDEADPAPAGGGRGPTPSALLPGVPSVSQPQDECSATRRGKDLEVDGGQEDEAGEAEGGTGSGEAAPEEGAEVEEVEQLEEEEEVQGAEAQSKRSSSSLEEAFERELVAQLEEYEQVIWELQDELQVTRTRYSLATGAAAGPGSLGGGGGGGWARDGGPRGGRPPPSARLLRPLPSLLSSTALTQEPSRPYNAEWVSRSPGCGGCTRRTRPCRGSFGSGRTSYAPCPTRWPCPCHPGTGSREPGRPRTVHPGPLGSGPLPRNPAPRPPAPS